MSGLKISFAIRPTAFHTRDSEAYTLLHSRSLFLEFFGAHREVFRTMRLPGLMWAECQIGPIIGATILAKPACT